MTVPGHFVGVDVGGTKVAVATLDDGRLSDSRVVPTRKGSSDELVDQLGDVIEEARTSDTLAVGLGVEHLQRCDFVLVVFNELLERLDQRLRALLGSFRVAGVEQFVFAHVIVGLFQRGAQINKPRPQRRIAGEWASGFASS